MSRKKITGIIIAATIILLLILFVPTSKELYDDGGTACYNALTYKVVVWNKYISDDPGTIYHKTSIYWYPDNQKRLSELWEMEEQGQ